MSFWQEVQLLGLSQVRQLPIREEQRSQLLLEVLIAKVSFWQDMQRVSLRQVGQLAMRLGQEWQAGEPAWVP